MKRILTLLSIILSVCLSMTMVCYAGDIISPLMEDDSQIYFGELKDFTEYTLTVIQKENVKGDFEQDKEYTYNRDDFTTKIDLEIGNIYLCTYFNDGASFMIWETTSTDTKTLEVLGDHTFAEQIEYYLNNGIFEKSEKEKIVKLNQSDNSKKEYNSSTFMDNNYIVIYGFCILIILLVIVFTVKKRRK